MANRKVRSTETAVRAAALAAAVSCSGQPNADDNIIDQGSEASDDVNEPIGNQANAVTLVGHNITKEMPKNPVYVTVEFDKADALEVYSPSSQEDPVDYPYPYEVVQTADTTVLETYVEYGEGTGVMLRPLKKVGVSSDGEPLYDKNFGPWTTFTIEASAQKFGSTDQIQFGDKDVIYSLSGLSKTTLRLGENTFYGPAADDFIDGETRKMLYGLFEAEQDMTLDIDFAGCEKVYLMQYGKIECKTQSFSVSCKAGMPIGICAVTESGTESVGVTLTPSVPEEE